MNGLDSNIHHLSKLFYKTIFSLPPLVKSLSECSQYLPRGKVNRRKGRVNILLTISELRCFYFEYSEIKLEQIGSQTCLGLVLPLPSSVGANKPNYNNMC